MRCWGIPAFFAGQTDDVTAPVFSCPVPASEITFGGIAQFTNIGFKVGFEGNCTILIAPPVCIIDKYHKYRDTNMFTKCNMPHLTLILPLLITGCSANQTSVERNASHAVSAINRIQFDPNTRLLRADSIKVMKPLMQQYYEQGKKDKQNGLTLSQAKQRVDNFHCPESYTGGDKTVILGKEYDADNPEKQQQIILSAAISAYWDGYNGKP